MTKYYNRKNGPLAITLLDGRTHYFPAREMTEISGDLESSPMLLRYIRKGHLHREVLIIKKESNKGVNLSFSKETAITVAIETKPVVVSQEEIKPEAVIEPELPITDEIENTESEEVKETIKRRKKSKELFVNAN